MTAYFFGPRTLHIFFSFLHVTFVCVSARFRNWNKDTSFIFSGYVLRVAMGRLRAWKKNSDECQSETMSSGAALEQRWH